ncbi:MAG: PEGA domain-containing protein [Methanolinea sp.]|nr:PEGA domain-containing protein [Methanolinea sp.]
MVSCTAMAAMTIHASIETGKGFYQTGSIYVASTPAGASAILDEGARSLFTPGTFTGVEPGTHSLKISRQGFFSRYASVKVTAGSTENVIVTLDPVSNPGGLSIGSEPRGASLYVDDRYMGKTNQVVGNLAPGTHAVRITEAGYVAWQKEVTVTGGTITPVFARLDPEVSPPSGDILVASIPPGAAVFINGDYRGSTTPDDLLDIDDLSPGQYVLVVSKPGYLDFTKTVSVEAGKVVQVMAPLAGSNQGIASAGIASTPAGADVFINSMYAGVTPLSVNDIPPGNYTVEIRLDGYSPFSTAGNVMGGQDLQIFAALQPLSTPTPTQKAGPGTFSLLVTACIPGILGLFFLKNRGRTD